MSKYNQPSIRLLAGLGVESDAHMGKAVKHRSRVRRYPSQPNLRQVHLIAEELHEELRSLGFTVSPGEMGENITTRGIDLLSVPRGTYLRIGSTARLEITGLRNPCKQLDGIAPGLMDAVISKGPAGEIVRREGIMAIVEQGGVVRAGDPITIELPATPHLALEPV